MPTVIKLIVVVRRRPGATREQFFSYWHNEHAKLVAGFKDVLRIRRYVQSHRIAWSPDDAFAETRGWSPSEYDGIAELWWDSLEDMQAAFSTPEGSAANQALREDERRFGDVADVITFVTEEHEIC